MAVVSLNIGGRFYRFSCNDGQELHMKELAELLNKKAQQLTASLGAMQETQLLALMCLLLEEDIFVMNKKKENLAEPISDSDSNDLVEKIQGLTQEVSSIIESLKE